MSEMWRRTTLVLLASWAFGCQPAIMYGGPRRPRSQVAKLSLKDATLGLIDGRRYRYLGSDIFEFLPGRHVFGVGYQSAENAVLVTIVTYSRQTQLICLDLMPGHRYVVISRMDKSRSSWRPTARDDDTGEWLDVTCGDDDDGAEEP
jgi:hypothetical protein